jgi:hypothetical protein
MLSLRRAEMGFVPNYSPCSNASQRSVSLISRSPNSIDIWRMLWPDPSLIPGPTKVVEATLVSLDATRIAPSER